MPKNLKDPVKEAEKKKSSSGWTAPKEYEEAWKFYLERKQELFDFRSNIKGINLETKFNEAEKNYLPHRVAVKSPRKIDNSQPNLYIKVQTALSIVLNTSFDATFSPGAEKFRKTNNFIKGLVMYSLDPAVTSTRQQYFNAAFNVALHGSGGLQTYRRYIERDVYGPDNNTKMLMVDKDEVEAEALHPKDYWIDDMARPGDRDSHNDWLKRKVYSFRTFKRKFPDRLFPAFKDIMPGGNTEQHLDMGSGKQTMRTSKNMIEVFFYENKAEDMWIVEANRACSFMPLPYASKNLSLSHGIWTLRTTETAYGLGLWEIIEQDQQLVDMVRDMTIEQLLLSIFSVIFHDGSNKIDEAKLKIEAGRFLKFLSPEKIKQFQLATPGASEIAFIERFQQDMDDASGISKTLSSASEDKTAFQANLNQEAALRRLRTPSNNLKELFEWELSNRVPMIQQVYSIPKLKHITEIEDMTKAQKELEGGKIEASDVYVDQEDKMFLKSYREVPLNLKEQPDGTYSPTEETNFFVVRPMLLEWRGTIRIDIKSLLISSEELDKQDDTALAAFLSPFIQQMAQMPALAAYYVPYLRNIILAYKKEPEEWIPPQFMKTYKDAMAQMLQDESNAAKQAQAGAPAELPKTAGVPEAAMPESMGGMMTPPATATPEQPPVAPTPGSVPPPPLSA